MFHDYLYACIARVQEGVRGPDLAVVKDFGWCGILFTGLCLTNDLLKRDDGERELRCSQNFTVQEAEMNTRLHLDHGVETMNRPQSA